MTEPLNYAERSVLLDRIEQLEAELLVERALNANLQTGIDATQAQNAKLRAELLMLGGVTGEAHAKLRAILGDAMTDHEVRTLGLEHTPEGLQVRGA